MKKYKVTVDGQVFNVVVEEITAPNSLQSRAAPHLEPASPLYPAEIRPEPQQQRLPAGGALNVEAPMPGSIVDIAVRRGDTVNEGDVLLILEAMKMENEITAPQPGTVREIHVKVGDTVGSGEILVELS